MTNKPNCIFLMGPTASGKTALAIELVKRFPVEIISVDSAMVYRGMDIGTAKPGPEILAQAPHRLIDIRDPAEAYSAADFREDALREMAEITASGKTPLLVGGTMLYFKALYDGLAEMPSADAAVRAEIEEFARQFGWPAVHAELAKVDPVSAERLKPTDSQRLQRALEVFRVTGRALSEFHAEQKKNRENSDQLLNFPYNAQCLAVAPQRREILHQRIALRFQQMLEQGLMEEVKQLYQRGDLSTALPSIRAVGYRQVWDCLDGKLDYAAMMERGIIATRQLAKRQFTWLRSWQGLHWIDSEDPELLQTALNCLPSDVFAEWNSC